MFRKPKIWIAVIAIALIATLAVALLPVGVSVNTSGNLSITLDTYEVLAAPGEVTYYFDTYGAEEWTATPEYMANNVLTNYASTTVNNQVERLTGNTCDGTDLDTITKVEIRAYAYGDGDDELYIRPEFIGGPGDNHITVPGISGGWGAYQDITNDTNAPGWSVWKDIQDLEVDIEYDKTGSSANMFVSKVEVRVTYSAGAPKGGSVVFVRSQEWYIDGYTLTISNFEVSAGTDRVLVLGVAYKDNNPQTPTSVTWNGTEDFAVVLHAADGGDAQICLYVLVNPTVTTADIVYTQPVENRMVGFVAYFTGVDQNNPFTAATSEAIGVDTAPTVDVSSAADEIVVSIMAQVSGGPDTIDTYTGTLICDGASTGGGTDTRGGGTYEVGQATTSVLYGMSSNDNWNIVAGALQEPVADPVITSAPDTWTLNGITGSGAIIPDTVYYANPQGDMQAPASTVADADCQFTVTNTSAMAIDLTLTMGTFTGGDGDMTNSDDGSNGATTYGAYSWFSGQLYANKVIIKSTGSSVGYDGLAATTDIMWGAEVKTRTNAWTGGSASTATLTITATVD